jgi:nucleotide-binding universal stress UspA family protein
MNIRDILVLLDTGSASAPRLKLATNIARKYGAHLEAIFLPPAETSKLQSDISVPLSALSSPKVSAIEIPKVAMLADIAEARFHDDLRFSGVEGKWQSLYEAKAADLIARATAADLIILGQSNLDDHSGAALRPEKIVVACGRPALVVPYAGSYTQVGHRVLIAWDGSREVVRAVHDALPLIGSAETVTVMTVRARAKDFEHDRSSIERVVYYLARHGVAARPAHALHRGSSVSDVLLSWAADIGADLIVAGAHYHSHLRDALMGGVSRRLFREMTVPMLTSH